MSHKRAAYVNKGTYNFRRFDEPEDIFLEDLRGECWNARVTWKALAERIGVTRETVRRFAVGDTRRPTFHTIFKLAAGLGMSLVKTSNVVPMKRRKK